MASDRDLREIAECIVASDEKTPGFWADLLVEVARIQSERRRRAATEHTTDTGPSEERLSPSSEPGDETEDLAGAVSLAAGESAGSAPQEPLPTPEEEPGSRETLETESETQGHPDGPNSSSPHRLFAPGPGRPRPFPQGVLDPPSEGCWQCGGPDHFRRECPRRNEFHAVQMCYRCGRKGRTVRTCPDCREGWLAQGPYIPGRESERPTPPRRRGLPPPMRRREHGYTGEE
ncbi:gag [Lasius niger]|uniref:Gag n=1 Tax=Lasius niger TaxID=67767 RepID=A0A0J7JY77_LASNI|nr:gag [Lasius niger]